MKRNKRTRRGRSSQHGSSQSYVKLQERVLYFRDGNNTAEHVCIKAFVVALPAAGGRGDRYRMGPVVSQLA